MASRRERRCPEAGSAPQLATTDPSLPAGLAHLSRSLPAGLVVVNTSGEGFASAELVYPQPPGAAEALAQGLPGMRGSSDWRLAMGEPSFVDLLEASEGAGRPWRSSAARAHRPMERRVGGAERSPAKPKPPDPRPAHFLKSLSSVSSGSPVCTGSSLLGFRGEEVWELVGHVAARGRSSSLLSRSRSEPEPLASAECSD